MTEAASTAEESFVTDVLTVAVGRHFTIERQVPVGSLIGGRSRLRLDAFIRHRTGSPVCAFELDGDRSHFGDPVQLERDARKDRLLRRAGLPVYRVRLGLLAVEARPAARRLCRALVWQAFTRASTRRTVMRSVAP